MALTAQTMVAQREVLGDLMRSLNPSRCANCLAFSPTIRKQGVKLFQVGGGSAAAMSTGCSRRGCQQREADGVEKQSEAEAGLLWGGILPIAEAAIIWHGDQQLASVCS